MSSRACRKPLRISTRTTHIYSEIVIFKIHLPDKEPYFYRIIPPMFEMLLMNLFTNAIKYNNAAVPRIDITFEKQQKKLIIRFKDNGIGIDKSELKENIQKVLSSRTRR